ncbi:MAG TPA: ABC transporter substrate-binding protein [Acidimicrobiales bacterium]|nr:ABC transporter substrate-binding protein [Acidimicrobiales bacterium]
MTAAGGAPPSTSASAGQTGSALPAPPPGGGGTDHSPIVIGSVGNYSGITGGAEAPGVVGLEAWVSFVNSRGGVNGHPVKLYVRDDQSDPGQNLADTQALVQQEHIVAEVSAWASQTQQASASYLRQQGIPVIGGDGTGAASWGQLPNFFPEGDIENTLVQDGPAAGAKLLFPKGDRNLAILVCQEGAVCSEGASIDSRYAPSIGWHVVYNGSASFAAPSYTAQCIQMKSAGAQAVVLIMPSSATVNVANSCDQQGFDPYWLIGYGVTEGNFNTIPGLRNSIVFNTTFPFTGGPLIPGVAEYQQAMKQYEPGQISDPASAAGWASAEIFGAAIAKISGPVTSASLTSALQRFRNQTFGGLTIPLSFDRVPVNPPPCWFVMTITASQWSAPYGDTPQCAG